MRLTCPRIDRKRPGVGRSAGVRLGLSIAVLSIVAAAAPAQQATAGRAPDGGSREPRRSRLYGVASSKTIDNLNRYDARAAIKAWFDLVAQLRGFILDSRFDIVDSVAEIRERLQGRSAELVMLSISDYLELESSHLVVPVLTSARGASGEALYSYVLLVRPASGTLTLAGLQGKNILVSSRNGSNTGLVWTDVLLGKEKLGRAGSFFASVKMAAKAQACILPLFFGTVDGCVVDEVNLNLAKEMNPQLGQLRVLARSRPMIESVIATPVEPHPYQQELIDAILSLHEDVRGRQLLTVFRTDRAVRIQPGDLDSARELWRDYNRLPNQPDRGRGGL